MKSSSLPIIIFFPLLLGCFSAKKSSLQSEPFRIAFYNVENLFDLEDDPATADDDFTPEGKQKWTSDRYQTKLDRIGEVVSGMEYPALLGLCEVENATVLNDLCKSENLKRSNYGFVHFDSPDFRGIDVALLYQKEKFQVLGSETIRIKFPLELVPDIPDYTTRDILVVKGIFQKTDSMHLIVTHFPSRRGGVEASQPKRLYVAQQVRKKVDEIFAENPNAKIVLMGDFNDETDNKSIAEVIGAEKFNAELQSRQLYNCFIELDEKKLGSYNYRGNWNMLDQIILSSSFFNEKNKQCYHSSTIYQQENMMYKDEKYGARPSRTYGGPNYYGGYSDHLPVFVEIRN